MESLAEVDPKIIQELREGLPKGPYAAGENFEALKWDYALVLHHDIEKIRSSIIASKSVLKPTYDLYRDLIDNYRVPCCYSGLFENLRNFLPECIGSQSSVKITLEVVDGMRDALAQDIACFSHKNDFPAYFESLAIWKQHTTYSMLKEMDMDRADPYKMVKKLYEQYKSCRKSGRSKLDALAHLQHGHLFTTTANFMTLVERMQYLEERVMDLEASRV